jgi:CDGSH-type Zn-finger protein
MDENKREYIIRIAENGPYRVTGGVPLIQRYPAMSIHGEPLEWDPVGEDIEQPPVRQKYSLCRCGHSANKPFCDDTHAEIGFDGSLTADRRPGSERRKAYQGAGIVMTDDTSLCSDVGFCGTRFTKVWQMIKQTDDPEVKARLMRMVTNCPSGRLEVMLEGDDVLEPEYTASIATVANGPLWVRGGIKIEAPDGFIYEVRNRVTLCRCGLSKNKPFCDGAHEQGGFIAP